MVTGIVCLSEDIQDGELVIFLHQFWMLLIKCQSRLYAKIEDNSDFKVIIEDKSNFYCKDISRGSTVEMHENGHFLFLND